MVLVVWLVVALALVPAVSDAATITVQASGGTYNNSQLQTAINAAACGDTITLEEGVTYTGNFTIPAISGCTTYTTITSRVSDSSFPASTARLQGAVTTDSLGHSYPGRPTTYAASMPTIVSSGGGEPAIEFAAGAAYWRFKHIKFGPVPQGYSAMVMIGYGDSTQTTRAQQPDHIEIDQCWFAGDTVFGQKRGVEMHGTNLTVKNSYFSDITSVGQDSQCIGGWNGYGPVTIHNNFLECATENVMFGGADPTMEVRMTITSPSATGGSVSVTNSSTLSELRVGQDISITTAAGVQHSYIASITGTGTTGSLTWSPAIANTPSTPGELRAGVVVDGVTITRNVFYKNPAWRYGVLYPPVMGTPTTSTASGSLGAGTYYYVFVSTNPDGYQGGEVHSGASSEVSATLGATGTITIPFTAAAGAAGYVIWRGTAPGTYAEFIGQPSSPFIDDGTGSWVTYPTPPDSTKYQIKNLFEIKAAKNSTVTGNIFMHSWQGSDIGLPFWWKSVNQDGNCWYCGSTLLTFANNIVKHVYGFFLINGHESYAGVDPPDFTGVSISNVLVCDSNQYWSNSGTSTRYGMQIFNSARTVTLDHLTVDHSDGSLMTVEEGTSYNITITNNMFRKGDYSIHDDTGSGQDAMDAAFSSYTFTNNAIAEGVLRSGGNGGFPAGNYFPNTAAWESEFTSYTTGCNADYSLRAAAAYKGQGTGSTDVGVNMTTLNAALNGVLDGIEPTTGGYRLRVRRR